MVKKDQFFELPIQYDEDCKFNHTLFIKQHKSKTSDEDFPTLLLLNLPFYCNKEVLTNIFKSCGKIVKICVQERPGNILESEEENSFTQKTNSKFHVAYIKFETLGGVDRALKLVKAGEKIVVSNLNVTVPVGINSFCCSYLKGIQAPTKLQQEIDDYMEAYDKKQQEQAEKEAEEEGVPDDDGWITVTSKGRNPGFKRTEVNQIKLEARKKKKRQNAQLFSYAYQIREAKREKVAELRKKFEADKAKIETMRKARKFRPY